MLTVTDFIDILMWSYSADKSTAGTLGEHRYDATDQRPFIINIADLLFVCLM